MGKEKVQAEREGEEAGVRQCTTGVPSRKKEILHVGDESDMQLHMSLPSNNNHTRKKVLTPPMKTMASRPSRRTVIKGRINMA